MARRKAEVPRIERDGTIDILDLVAHTMDALDERA
jgi:hypothetical protein